MIYNYMITKIKDFKIMINESNTNISYLSKYEKDTLTYEDGIILNDYMMYSRLMLSDISKFILYDDITNKLDIRCISTKDVVFEYKKKMSDIDPDWKYFKLINIQEAITIYRDGGVSFYYFPNLKTA